jgi:DNA-binding NarL/FixJ family response regulator
MTDRIRELLIVDDDAVDRLRIRRFLAHLSPKLRWRLEEADSITAGLRMLELKPFDCVLLDYNLPDGHAPDFLSRMATRISEPPPVIIQTVMDDEEAGLRLIEQGAQDYLVKGRFDSHDLVRAIRHACERHRLLREKVKLIARLEAAQGTIRTLEGIIPICMVCKKIRSDTGYWSQVEHYLSEHIHASFSHGVCPDCLPALRHEMGLPDDAELP